MMTAKSHSRPTLFDASPAVADELGSPLSRMAQRLDFGTASTSERGAFVGEKHAVRTHIEEPVSAPGEDVKAVRTLSVLSTGHVRASSPKNSASDAGDVVEPPSAATRFATDRLEKETLRSSTASAEASPSNLAAFRDAAAADEKNTPLLPSEKLIQISSVQVTAAPVVETKVEEVAPEPIPVAPTEATVNILAVAPTEATVNILAVAPTAIVEPKPTVIHTLATPSRVATLIDKKETRKLTSKEIALIVFGSIVALLFIVYMFSKKKSEGLAGGLDVNAPMVEFLR
jgi:hypothetical protein